MKPSISTPVYRHNASYAREHGELDQYRDSHWTTIACKNAIDAAISRGFDGMHLPQSAVTEVLDQYGAERVQMVLAATIRTKAWDGRFSTNNKDWAFAVELPDVSDSSGHDRLDAYTASSHPAVLDGYVHMARQEIITQEKQSVMEALHSPVAASAKQTNKKDTIER